MKGVAKIKGPLTPKVGETNFYEVVEFHKGTVVTDQNSIKWKLYADKDGKWDELSGPAKTGKKVTYSFPQKWYGKKLLVEAYIYDAEGKTPPGIVIKPVLGPKKIVNAEILDANGGKITKPPKYGETVTLKVTTENMLGDTLNLSLWDRDTYSDKGHDPKENTQLWSGISKPIDNKGVSTTKVTLSANMLVLANKSMFDGAEHEYYLLVDGGKDKMISTTTQVSNEVVLSPSAPAKKADPKPAPKEEPSILDQITLKIKNALGWDKPTVGGTTNATVGNEELKVEGIITAYFAKEEFTKETSESAGEYKYSFANNNDNIDKDKISAIIKKKVDDKVKSEKKYSKLEDIKNALTATSYKKNESISFNLYKLGSNFKKINDAPLEEEVFVVANTYLLNGKEVTIKIKEKDQVLVGADADLPVLESKENGAEISTLKATVEEGIAKVKVKLRPKSDEDLKKWKEKLAGIKDGTHTYKFGSDGNSTKSSEEKKKIAGIIAGKIKDTLTGQKKFAKLEAIEKALTKDVYNKDEQITFDVYKSVTENLWLKAECQGTKKHQGEFLKRDGEYFVIGKKCECEARIRAFMRMLRIGEGTEGETGYTTQYSGTQFTDMTKHPENVITAGSYSSSAAGAYQIMRYTWWWLAGEKLTDSNTKAGVYEESHDYIKKYSIPDFTAESQDKLCVIILKHKRAGSLDLITQNKIKESLEKYGSYEWASLPPGRYGQPTQTMEVALKKYDEFLKDELAGKTNLHIKNGFLKEFNISCNCSTKSSKTGYDIDAAVTYIESHAESSSISACAKYVRKAIEAGGLSTTGRPGSAKDYDAFLPTIGFTRVDTGDYVKGDIVVFDSVPGHPHGHIAMWTGTQWVSDFKQNSIIVNSAYNDGTKSIFRWQ